MKLTTLPLIVWTAAVRCTAADGLIAKTRRHGVLGLGISPDPPLSTVATVKRSTHPFLLPRADATLSVSGTPISMPTAAAISLRGGASPTDGSILVRVMKVHRFVALAFGLLLLVAPALSIPGVDLRGNMSVREELPNQCWGSFLIAVAYIIHVASTKDGFTEFARVEIAKALCVAYGLTTGLFIRHFLTQEMDREESKACVVTGTILAVISAAYGLGIVMS